MKYLVAIALCVSLTSQADDDQAAQDYINIKAAFDKADKVDPTTVPTKRIYLANCVNGFWEITHLAPRTEFKEFDAKLRLERESDPILGEMVNITLSDSGLRLLRPGSDGHLKVSETTVHISGYKQTFVGHLRSFQKNSKTVWIGRVEEFDVYANGKPDKTFDTICYGDTEAPPPPPEQDGFN